MKRKIINFSLVLLLLLTTLSLNVFADTQQEDISVNIHPGELSLEVPEVLDFGEITLTSEPEDYLTGFDGVFNIKDLTGTQSGWRLDVSSTTFSIIEPDGGFASGTDAYSLPEGTFALAGVDTIERVGDGVGVLPSILLSDLTVIDNGVISVAEASEGTGMGEFDLSFPTEALQVTIDATTAKVDTVNYP